jgi:ubiquinone/menaquinone biosynthesis C-methylase UbiE
MLPFESEEYWRKTTWDRATATSRARERVQTEFLRQVQQTVLEVERIAKHEPNSLMVLDVPCGTGAVSEMLIERIIPQGHITLADINSSTLQIARERLRLYADRLTFIESDVYNLPADFSSRFDIIVCLDFFHHSSHPQSLVDLLHRCLKPGGHLIANSFNSASYTKWDRLKYGRILSAKRQLFFRFSTALYPHAPPRLQRFIREFGLARIAPMSRSELTEVLQNLTIVHLKSCYYHWFSARKQSTSIT